MTTPCQVLTSSRHARFGANLSLRTRIANKLFSEHGRVSQGYLAGSSWMSSLSCPIIFMEFSGFWKMGLTDCIQAPGNNPVAASSCSPLRITGNVWRWETSSALSKHLQLPWSIKFGAKKVRSSGNGIIMSMLFATARNWNPSAITSVKTPSNGQVTETIRPILPKQPPAISTISIIDRDCSSDGMPLFT